MQDCFRKYPDVYGAEIADEDAAEAEAAALADGSPAPAVDAKDAESVTPAPSHKEAQASEKKHEAHEYTTEEHKAGPTDAPKDSQPLSPAAASQAVGEGDSEQQKEAKEGSERGVPKSSFDATAANAKAAK